MVQRRSNRGQPVDFDKLMAQQGNRPAVGNMGTDAKGNRLGPGGVIVQKNEDRVREYLKNTPAVSNDQVSLKGPALQPDNQPPMPGSQPKTANTAKENQRTQSRAKPVPVPEPDEFAAPQEPLGYKEVTLDNGDIQMVPYYRAEDA
jgi:hypothetical protein